jgi:hypothetical protein
MMGIPERAFGKDRQLTEMTVGKIDPQAFMLKIGIAMKRVSDKAGFGLLPIGNDRGTRFFEFIDGFLNGFIIQYFKPVRIIGCGDGFNQLF